MVTPVTCDRCRASFGNPHDIVTARAKQQLLKFRKLHFLRA